MCFIRQSDAIEDPLVKDVLKYIEALSVKIGAEVESRFSLILARLDEIKVSEMGKENQKKSSPLIQTDKIDKLKQRYSIT